MSLDTYANLKTEIADTLDRDDLTDQIDTFIDLAEARHRREVRTREMISRSSITIESRQISLPIGFLDAINLRILTTPVTILKNVNYHELNRIRSESTGKPEYFTISNEIEFDKSPDSSYSGEIVYWQSQTALSDSQTTNDILDNHPDLYLYGSLIASAPFLMDDPRIVVWKALYDDARDAANMQARKGRTVGPLVSRVSGITP